MAKKAAKVEPISSSWPVHQLPIDDLARAPENPRIIANATADDTDALRDSILADGILVPLIGYFDEQANCYRITAGGRRLAILKENADRLLFAPVRVMPKEAAIIAGMAEQVTHLRIETADIVRLFARPDGLWADRTISEMAASLGLTRSRVKQLERIRELPERLVAGFVAGNVRYETLAAAARWSNEDITDEVIDGILDGSLDEGSFSTRGLETDPFSTFKWSHFVSLEDYRNAGGRLQTDLFDLADPIVLDPQILETIGQKAAEARARETWPGYASYLPAEKMTANHAAYTGVWQMPIELVSEWNQMMDTRWKSRTAPERAAFEERFKELAAFDFYKVPDDARQYLDLFFRVSTLGDERLKINRVAFTPTGDLDRIKALFVENGWLTASEAFTGEDDEKWDQDDDELDDEEDGIDENEDGEGEDGETGDDEAPPPRTMLEISFTAKSVIEKIVLHAARMELAKSVDSIFALYARQLGGREKWLFNAIEDASHGDPDMGCVESADYAALQAVYDAKEFPETPEDQRRLIAFVLLQKFVGHKAVSGVNVRDYWTPTTEFFQLFKKAELATMLDTTLDQQSKVNLVSRCVDKFAPPEAGLPACFI